MDDDPEPDENSASVTRCISAYGSVTHAIVAAIADATGTDPSSVTPIYNAVDTDGLDTLLKDTDRAVAVDLQILFTVENCRVRIYGDGRVVVTPPDD
ncbi:HalOD1 output domain-containing protein [Natrinema caseinilyticum]|uniref:HalOD1 output domain-containing protein n=1 Tax=Natrinema caseinilyticum TaxID=2961570 RepID=UPI0020C45324|nr:HalOD1 output domain-containing protein [Natrinema caseinilyticum]